MLTALSTSSSRHGQPQPQSVRSDDCVLSMMSYAQSSAVSKAIPECISVPILCGPMQPEHMACQKDGKQSLNGTAGRFREEAGNGAQNRRWNWQGAACARCSVLICFAMSISLHIDCTSLFCDSSPMQASHASHLPRGRFTPVTDLSDEWGCLMFLLCCLPDARAGVAPCARARALLSPSFPRPVWKLSLGNSPSTDTLAGASGSRASAMKKAWGHKDTTDLTMHHFELHLPRRKFAVYSASMRGGTQTRKIARTGTSPPAETLAKHFKP